MPLLLLRAEGAEAAPPVAVSASLTATLEVGFVAHPTTSIGDTTWVDISAYLLSAQWQRGRPFELDEAQAGTATFRLNNSDGRFEPDYTGSPYYPNVKPMKRIRLTVSGTVVFTGHVTAWPPAYLAPSASITEISCVDGFEGLAHADLVAPNNALNNPGFEKNPGLVLDGTEYWTVVNGTLTRDTGRAKYGEASGKLTGHAVSASAVYPAGVPDGLGGPGGVRLGLTPGGEYTVSCWMFVPSGLGITLLNVQVFIYFGKVGSWSFERTASPVTFDTWELVYVTSLAADGFGHSGAADDAYVGIRIAEAGATKYINFDAFQVHEAISTREPGASMGRATTGDRVEAVLDYVDWPDEDRVIDTGRTELRAATTDEDSDAKALQPLQTAADAELGVFFVDGQGRAVFHGRERRQQATASVATFSDTGAFYPYRDLRPSYDVDRVINEAKISREGGTMMRYGDATSQLQYMRRTVNKSGMPFSSPSDLGPTDVQTEGYANALVYLYKDPQKRFEEMTTGLIVNQTQAHLDAILEREIGDRITVMHTVPGTSTVETLVCFVESVSGTLAPMQLELTWQLSPAPADTGLYFTVEHSTLGEIENPLAY